MKKFAHEKTYLFLKGYYFIRFIADAFFYAMLYVYLSHVGLTSDKIGLISALTPFLALIGNIVFQRVAKNLDINRVLMIVLGLSEAAFALLFVIFRITELLPIIVILGFVSIVNTPFYSLLDGYSGTYIEQENKQFSSMRIMGTIAYLFATLSSGYIVKWFGYQTLFGLSAFFFFITALLTLFLPHQEVTSRLHGKFVKTKFVITANLVIYLLFNLLIVAPSLVSDNFFIVYLNEVIQVESDVVGIITSLALLVETITFIFIIYKKNMFQNTVFALVFMGITLSIRPILMAVTASPVILIALSSLRGLALGYYIVFNVRYLSRLVPLKQLTSVLFTTSIFLTVGRIGWSLLLGYGIFNFGYDKTYIVTNIIFFLTLAVLVICSIAFNSKKHLANKKTSSI